jgi:hypothetical protein
MGCVEILATTHDTSQKLPDLVLLNGVDQYADDNIINWN